MRRSGRRNDFTGVRFWLAGLLSVPLGVAGLWLAIVIVGVDWRGDPLDTGPWIAAGLLLLPAEVGLALYGREQGITRPALIGGMAALPLAVAGWAVAILMGSMGLACTSGGCS